MSITENDNLKTFEDLNKLRESIQSLYIGQKEVIDQVLVSFLAKGHILLEGVPGLGKTLLVKILAKLIDAEYSRIQFTPDLMPADVTGHMLYDHQTGSFKVNKGPVFTNLLLTDEINRSPAKTQAALLEVMEEMQVTLDGTPMKLKEPFMVLATQNPIEQEGTYNLPEAQLDRFLLKVNINYPDEEDESKLLNEIAKGDLKIKLEELEHVLDIESVLHLQQQCKKILVDDSIQKYILDIIRATRDYDSISYGAGPRGGISLINCSRAYALLQNREYVIPDDVKEMVLPVLRHRIIISPEYELAGTTPDSILLDLVNKIPVPRQ